jgi:hypothetical protein
VSPLPACLTAAVLLAAGVAALPAPAEAQGRRDCETGPVAVQGAAPVAYSPFASTPTREPVRIELSGPAGTTVHARFDVEPGELDKVEVSGLSGAGTLAVLGGTRGRHPASSASMSQWWAPVSLDGQGRGMLDVSLDLGAGQPLTAGSWPVGLELRIACSDSRGRIREQEPLLLAPRTVQVAPMVGAAALDRSSIDLGPIPPANPSGWNNGQSATLAVQATAPFQVRLVNPVLLLRHAGAVAAGPITTIPYDLEIGAVVLDGRAGGRRTVSCWMPGAGGSLETRVTVAPLLPPDAAAGRLAGRYRDQITLSVEPLELAAPTAAQGACQ